MEQHAPIIIWAVILVHVLLAIQATIVNMVKENLFFKSLKTATSITNFDPGIQLKLSKIF